MPNGLMRGWFVELSAARSGGAFGPNPISFGEIRHWAELTGRRPMPFEVQLLRSLDAALLNVKPPQADDDEAGINDD